MTKKLIAILLTALMLFSTITMGLASPEEDGATVPADDSAALLLLGETAASLGYIESEPARPAAADVEPYLRTWVDAPGTTTTTQNNFGRTAEMPVGNGHMGATIYGGVLQDVMIMNEKTVWSGGPSMNSSSFTWNHGISRTQEQVRGTMFYVQREMDRVLNQWASGQVAYPGYPAPGPTGIYPMEIQAVQSPNQTNHPIIWRFHNQLFGDGTNQGQYQELSKLYFRDPLYTHAGRVGNIQTNQFGSLPTSTTATTSNNVRNIFANSTTYWQVDQVPTEADPIWVEWEYGEPVTFSSYVISGQNANTNPTDWVLYGSTDGVTYSVIDTKTGFTSLSGTTAYTVNLAGSVTSRYFKFVATKVTGGAGATQGLRLSRLYPNNVPTANTPSATNAQMFKDYSRVLNLETGVATVTYERIYGGDSTKFKKEYFMNYPDNVYVVKMSADKPFSQTITLDTLHVVQTIIADEENATLTMTGMPSGSRPENGGLHFMQQIKVIPLNGTVRSVGYGLEVSDTTEFVLIMAAGTNYYQCMDDTFNYFYDKEAAFAKIEGRIAAALKLGYNALLRRHLEDYQELFGRVDFRLDDVPVPTRPTSMLVGNNSDTATRNRYNNATELEKRYIEMLFYQYGRYLLIGSSREGSLPANLQGVWSMSLSPPWRSDYHLNINLQMAYWPAQSTNLAETHIPLTEYITSLVPSGRKLVQHYHTKPYYGPNGTYDPNIVYDPANPEHNKPVRGWATHLENSVWGHVAPTNWWQGGYSPTDGTWLSLDIWTYYQYTQDEAYLRKNYDTLIEAALYWVDMLWEDSSTRINGVVGTGKLVANPSYSPEHGPYDLGTTFNQGVIWEAFEYAQKAYDALGGNVTTRPNAAAEIAEIKEAQSKLYLPHYDEETEKYVGIGSQGQFMEWRYETIQDVMGTDAIAGTGGKHRHANHLFMLHPGTFIVPGRSEHEDAFADAMRRTLLVRGEDAVGTSWSKGWTINFWARLRDGEKAHQIYRELLNNRTLPNLWSTHEPYQIDGNFGATAGITEFFLQSQGGYAEFLPALPQTTWPNGHMNGLVARGNFVVGMEWADGIASKFTVESRVGGTFTGYYDRLSLFEVFDSSGNAIPFTKIDVNKISFATVAGETYTLTPLTYMVTFDSAGGSEVAAVEVKALMAVSEPAAPVWFGYTFLGWYLGNDPYDFDALVAGDITLVALWSRNPITSIQIANTNGVAAPAAVTVMRNSTVQFDYIINADALREGIVWTVSNEAYATVNAETGLVTLKNMTGTVILTAKDSLNGAFISIVLRIV